MPEKKNKRNKPKRPFHTCFKCQKWKTNWESLVSRDQFTNGKRRKFARMHTFVNNLRMKKEEHLCSNTHFFQIPKMENQLGKPRGRPFDACLKKGCFHRENFHVPAPELERRARVVSIFYQRQIVTARPLK